MSLPSATPCCLFLSGLLRLAARLLREWAPKRKKRRKRPETVFGLYRVIALSSASCLPNLGLYFPFRGPFMFDICRVCIQYESFNNFENDTNNESVNEIKLTGFWARNRAAIQQNFLPGPQSYRDFRETELRSCLTLSLHCMSCFALLVLLFFLSYLVFTCLSLYLHAMSRPASLFLIVSLTLSLFMACLVLRCSFYYFSCPILYLHASACICMPCLVLPSYFWSSVLL